MKARKTFSVVILVFLILLSGCGEKKDTPSSRDSLSESGLTRFGLNGDPSVISFSINRSTLLAGDRFTLNATVLCTFVSCPSSSISFRRDTRKPVIRSDTLVGTARIPSLANGAKYIVTYNATALENQYYGACTERNCQHSNTKVAEVYRPPLFPSKVKSFEIIPYRPPAGESVQLRATMDCNAPLFIQCGVTRVSFHSSPDATVNSDDTNIGMGEVRVLPSISTPTRVVTFTTIAVEGLYYGACVGNNCEDAGTGNPVGPPPTPSVISFSLSTSTPTAGQEFTLNAIVLCPTGSECRATSISFRRDAFSPIISSDTLVRAVTIPALRAGANYTATTITTAVAGQYYGACIGTDCDHSSMRVPILPDWLYLSQQKIPDSFSPGENATLTVAFMCTISLCNSITVSFHRSDNSQISQSDATLGFLDLLLANQGESRIVTLMYEEPLGLDDRYWYGVCIDNYCSP